jgi:hypothetical protein
VQRILPVCVTVRFSRLLLNSGLKKKRTHGHFAASSVSVYSPLFCNVSVAKWRTFASVHLSGPLYFSTLKNSGRRTFSKTYGVKGTVRRGTTYTLLHCYCIRKSPPLCNSLKPQNDYQFDTINPLFCKLAV